MLRMLPPLRCYMLHCYPYMHTPAQLAFLLAKLDQAIAAVPAGSVVEVGCAARHTTIFLARHLRERGFEGRYLAYDTFAGFMREDVAEEMRAGRVSDAHQLSFHLNHKQWVEWSLAQNKKRIDVELVEAGAAEHAFAEITEPIAFALLDVDVYRPTQNALKRLYPKLAPGGVMVLDDCMLDDKGAPRIDAKFAGGHAALVDWRKESKVPISYDAGKCAAIERS